VELLNIKKIEVNLLKKLVDGYGRVVDYIRVSVTERCNFRCTYCMPQKPFEWIARENILSYEELFNIIKVAIDNGIKKVRITGGEPTVREHLDRFINLISEYDSNIDIALTTNGFLLKNLAKQYREAGLKRVNISLDSLKVEVAAKIAQKDVLGEVLAGIDNAIDSGLKVKINCVPLKNINDIEIVDILEFCMNKNISIRYIEFMENNYANSLVEGLNSLEILSIISQKYKFEEVARDNSSPSKYYRLDNAYEFGIIEPHADDFCKTCNRIRVTAEGFLIPCLYFEDAINIKDSIKDSDKLLENFKEVLKNKPEKNRWGVEKSSDRAFYITGG
jgi:cyclic pyranopterin phosphate synthase